VGDGPEKPTWEAWAQEHGLDSCAAFHGWLPRPALAEFYNRAHFMVLPSASEGWPKVLSEAMAYGAVPLAGAVSAIPQILAETGAGAALPPLDVAAFKDALLAYVAWPDRWRAASQASRAAAPNFSYDHYLGEVDRMFRNTRGSALKDHWSNLSVNE
jgi:glycosyltransferase involved in cell wall biosynthesis